MSDDSPFADFTTDSQPTQQSTDDNVFDEPQIDQSDELLDEDQPIALPPPTQSTLDEPVDDDDGFGLSSPPPAASGEDNLDSDPFATVDGGSTENAGAFDSFSNQQVEVKEEEAAALKQWENERSKVLRERAAKAESDKQTALTTAREEVQKFYADRDATVAKQQKTNRADEKNYRADMKTTFESGQRWEKVSKLISTQPRPNEKAGTSRVDRMRKLLIQLKAEKK